MPFALCYPRSPGPRGQRGFTLIEIMVVVVILGILAAMVVPKVLDRPDQARATAAKQDIGGLMQALKLYRLDHGSYPSMNQGLKVLVERRPMRRTALGVPTWSACPTTLGVVPTTTSTPARTAKSISFPSAPTASPTATV